MIWETLQRDDWILNDAWRALECLKHYTYSIHTGPKDQPVITGALEMLEAMHQQSRATRFGETPPPHGAFYSTLEPIRVNLE